jgi:8-oxo-dGTP pyrophosphatase MutT (NUDIX family)
VADDRAIRKWAADATDKGFDAEVSELIPAATVIPLRDGPDGIETLMLRRNSKLEFAGGMWVFPGGRVDPADRRDDDADELAPAARAAVREAREEADIELDESSLVVFSHWAPPSIAPKRFATWFFLASAPEGDITIDGGEIHDHAWFRPDDALEARDALEIELAPPTWITLFELSRFADVDEALGGCATREPEHFTTHVALVDGGVVALWHGDAGYDDEDVDCEGPRHRLWMVGDGWRYERD